MMINVRDVVVGDICLLEPGEIIPVDGIFLRGHNVRCDESGATGESDAIKKFSYEECMKEKEGLEPGKNAKKDCFMISGAKVLEGMGEYVVIAVGKTSFNGRIMMSELKPYHVHHSLVTSKLGVCLDLADPLFRHERRFRKHPTPTQT